MLSSKQTKLRDKIESSNNKDKRKKLKDERKRIQGNKSSTKNWANCFNVSRTEKNSKIQRRFR